MPDDFWPDVPCAGDYLGPRDDYDVAETEEWMWQFVYDEVAGGD